MYAGSATFGPFTIPANGGIFIAHLNGKDRFTWARTFVGLGGAYPKTTRRTIAALRSLRSLEYSDSNEDPVARNTLEAGGKESMVYTNVTAGITTVTLFNPSGKTFAVDAHDAGEHGDLSTATRRRNSRRCESKTTGDGYNPIVWRADYGLWRMTRCLK